MVDIALSSTITPPPISKITPTNIHVEIDANLSGATISLVVTLIEVDLTIGGTQKNMIIRRPPGVTYANLLAQLPTLIQNHIDANGNII